MNGALEKGISAFLQAFLDRYLVEIDKLHNDRVYENIMKIKQDKLKYEDVEWLFMEECYFDPQASIKDILEIENAKPVLKYIQKIIGSKYSYRDKLVLLCGYIEPYFYEQVDMRSHGQIKKDLDEMVDKTHSLSMKDYRSLIIYMLAAIIFKDGRNRDYELDKRLPHRNCILHNGIVSFSDDEVKMAYYTLAVYIYMIYDYSAKNREMD